MSISILPSLDINLWTKESLANLLMRITIKATKPLILIDGIGGSERQH